MTYNFFQLIYVNLKMDKMTSLNADIINLQVGNKENKGVIYCWETYKFRSVKISGSRNQCLQYCLNAFYNDVNELKKQPFSGQLRIGVNMKFVVQMRMLLYLTGC